MATLNQSTRKPTVFTHEGGKAKRINHEQELLRSVMACMLWEDTFYENGVAIADRIAGLVAHVDSDRVASIAIEARENMKLRHVPLMLARTLAADGYCGTAILLERIIQRPDELTEFLAIYWKDGKCPLSAQVKKGLAKAFTKFNAYSLAKYNRDNAIRLRDVMFLCHPKPINDEQAIVFKQLAENTLPTPDTWEVGLSVGEDKKATWERLMTEKKLGGLALIRNLRNMESVGVDENIVRDSLRNMNAGRILPFRFIAAAKHAPRYEPELEQAMMISLGMFDKLPGKTVLLIDVSGSMSGALSGNSTTSRIDAANGLAICLREICENAAIYTFSNECVFVPPRRGFALSEAIDNSQNHGETYLAGAIKHINDNEHYDRIIVITDEQSHDGSHPPNGGTMAYMINVASYRNGVGYHDWIHIDGWSEAIVNYVFAIENSTGK